MRRGVVVGALVGAALSLAVGVFAAVLPTTPTWTLWRIKTAIDANDVRGLSELVDIPAVAQRAVTDLDAAKGGFDLGQAAMALFSGGKVITVFNDPEKPLHVTGRDVLVAWWGMRRDGDLVYVTLPAGERPIDLILGLEATHGWRIVGVTPIGALIKIKAKRGKDESGAAPAPTAAAVDASRGEG